MSLPYKKGKLDGKVNYWSDDGILINSQEYINGVANSEYYSFNVADSLKIYGYYKDGLKNGNWKFVRNNLILKELKYKKGELKQTIEIKTQH